MGAGSYDYISISVSPILHHSSSTLYLQPPSPSPTLRWRHNGCDSVSNHQPHHCLLNRLSRRRSKKTSKLRVTGLCVGNSPGTGEFSAQMASNAKNASIWWRPHDLHFYICIYIYIISISISISISLYIIYVYIFLELYLDLYLTHLYNLYLSMSTSLSTRNDCQGGMSFTVPSIPRGIYAPSHRHDPFYVFGQ